MRCACGEACSSCPRLATLWRRRRGAYLGGVPSTLIRDAHAGGAEAQLSEGLFPSASEACLSCPRLTPLQRRRRIQARSGAHMGRSEACVSTIVIKPPEFGLRDEEKLSPAFLELFQNAGLRRRHQ
jgi:hypothetical protein